MKINLLFLTVFTCLLISCNGKDEKAKIKISSNYADYSVNEMQAIEENKSEEFDYRNKANRSALDSSWLMERPIIDEMNNGDFIVLKYRMQGCFGGESKNIILKKYNSKIFCILANNLIVQLSDYQIGNFRKLESLLYQITKYHGGCTTQVTYKFYLGNRLRTYINGTCEYDKVLDPLTGDLLLNGISVEN